MVEEVGTLDAGARAALDGGKPLVTVGPPAAWSLAPVFLGIPREEEPGLRVLVLAPEPGDLIETARMVRRLPSLEPIHAVTGAARSTRLLLAGAVRTLLVTPRDALGLLQRAALPFDKVHSLLVLWPEVTIGQGESATLDAVLAEAKVPRKVFATSDDGALREFLDRYARRAPVAILGRVPDRPAGGVRYAVVDETSRHAAVRGALDTLNPERTLLWEPAADRYERWHELVEDPSVTVHGAVPAEGRFSLAIAADLPSVEILAAMAARSDQVIVLARAVQLPYLHRLAKPLRPLKLTGAADRARERAHALRQSVRERVEGGDVSAELMALAPLFDEYDPALVAAALARSTDAPGTEPAPVTAWVKLQVNIGKRDRVRPADIVGALLNGVGMPKDHVGRVDIKDTFTVVEVRLDDSSRVVSELSRLTVRGRSLAARIV